MSVSSVCDSFGPMTHPYSGPEHMPDYGPEVGQINFATLSDCQ